MNISKIMSQDVHSCKTDDTLEFAAGKMWRFDLGCLPVLDASNEIVGLLTDRDICMAAYTQGLPLHGIRVSSAMSQHVFSCAPDDTIQEAAEKMSAHQLHRLPVMVDEKIVGIVSLNDIAREAERELGNPKQHVTAVEILTTLTAVCQPREVPATI